MAAPKNSPTIRALVAGNWKMNGSKKDLSELRKLATALKPSKSKGRVKADVMICPPATLLPRMADQKAKGIALGGQDCHANISGAHTGDISAEMLKRAGAKAVILGHSERRAHFGETDETVGRKVEAAVRHGMTPLVCIGETLDEREAGRAKDVLTKQVRGALGLLSETQKNAPILLAYEPVWAIGEHGIPATADYANARQAEIGAVAHDVLGQRVPCLYGGSVNPENCEELIGCPHIDGLFIGRSAWKIEGYLDILAKCAAHIRKVGEHS